jgi:hypothetical protein
MMKPSDMLRYFSGLCRVNLQREQHPILEQPIHVLLDIAGLKPASPAEMEIYRRVVEIELKRRQPGAVQPDLLPAGLAEVRRCRVCGCTDNDCRQCIEKTGTPCHWVGPNLCSACA